MLGPGESEKGVAVVHVLVTGGAGFIGGHTCTLLLAAGHRVSVVDNLATGRRENVPAGAQLIVADVTHPELAGICADLRFDAVVHLAAQISVSHSVADPMGDARTNIEGTLNVLEAARAGGARTFVFASSAAVYGVPEALPLTEAAAARPLSPYGLSKLTAESYIRMFTPAHGMRHAILRLANVYGPGQSPAGEAGVVAIFCDRIAHGLATLIHGDGEQTRDFIYVGDVAAAIGLAAASGRPAETFNVGTGSAISVNELWHSVRGAAARRTGPDQAAGLQLLTAVYGAAREGDIRHSYLSNTRIREFLGWHPQVDLQTGLSRTLNAQRAGAANKAV